MGWLLGALGAFLATLGTGIWTGWALRAEHNENVAAARPPAAAGDRAPAVPSARSPLPFPGQFLLEIQDPDEDTGDWLRPLLESNGVEVPRRD